jgi:ribosome-binding factor A
MNLYYGDNIILLWQSLLHQFQNYRRFDALKNLKWFFQKNMIQLWQVWVKPTKHFENELSKAKADKIDNIE